MMCATSLYSLPPIACALPSSSNWSDVHMRFYRLKTRVRKYWFKQLQTDLLLAANGELAFDCELEPNATAEMHTITS